MPKQRELANAIRALAMDAVQAANSGHPGAPMGMADIAEVLWRNVLNHNPNNPQWANRDRFVLSNGHGSMLLYALLHLSGYDLPIAELKNFRQLHSRTPGHPEYGYAPGVETTTGPLGQGLANAVGMALAEAALAGQFNRPQHAIIDHYTYCFVGDGCLMEGISHEVCSLAGTLGLGKLIVCYDDNGISIDGEVEHWFSDNTMKRFEAYGWQVIPRVDGHDPEEISIALQTARNNRDQPTLICCKTVIGYGAPNKQGTEAVHGAPLGVDEIAQARAHLGWQHPPFVIPDEVRLAWDARAAGAAREATWQNKWQSYAQAHPELAAELKRRIAGELPADFTAKAQALVAQVAAQAETIATRKASQNAIEALAPLLPELLGGSADLAGSNLTLWSNSKPISAAQPGGNYVHYGVREFGMTAIMNGVALHGGFLPFGGTFLMFMEYARNAVRMAALMRQRVLLVYTHDSIGLGEDGPTHQPVEQLAALRSTPNMETWRPCDTVESIVAWLSGVQRHSGPTALIFSRQSLPFQVRTPEQISLIERGGYILQAPSAPPEVILLATGSEVSIAMAAAEQLTAEGRVVQVVSMPCMERFLAQDAAYREQVLPSSVRRRVAVEAGSTGLWHQFVGLEGAVIGIDCFGESAPGDVLYRHFGLVPERVVAAVKTL